MCCQYYVFQYYVLPHFMTYEMRASNDLTISLSSPLFYLLWGPDTVFTSTEDWPSLPACDIQISQSHPPIGTRGPPLPLDTTEPAFYSPCLFTLFLSTAHLWPCVVCSVLLPRAVSTTGKLLLI